MALTSEQKDLLVVMQRRTKAAAMEYQYESTDDAEKSEALAEAVDSLVRMGELIKHGVDTPTREALQLVREALNVYHQSAASLAAARRK
ncbi:hypothetical protein ACT3R7_12100 [Halomonas sp. AOP43-A1-21]